MHRYRNIIQHGLACASYGRRTPLKDKMLCKYIQAEKDLYEVEMLKELEDYKKFDAFLNKHRKKEMLEDAELNIGRYAKYKFYDDILDNDDDRDYARRRRYTRHYDSMDDDDRDYARDRRLRQNRYYKYDRRRNYDMMDGYAHHIPYQDDYAIGYEYHNPYTRRYDHMDDEKMNKAYHELTQYLKINLPNVYDALKHHDKKDWMHYLKQNQPLVYDQFKDKIYM